MLEFHRKRSCGKSPGTRRFQLAVVGGRLIKDQQHASGRMRVIASNNHLTQAGRLPGRLIPINTSLPTTARWKRRVPGGDFHSFMASQRGMKTLAVTTKVVTTWRGLARTMAVGEILEENGRKVFRN